MTSAKIDSCPPTRRAACIRANNFRYDRREDGSGSVWIRTQGPDILLLFSSMAINGQFLRAPPFRVRPTNGKRDYFLSAKRLTLCPKLPRSTWSEISSRSPAVTRARFGRSGCRLTASSSCSRPIVAGLSPSGRQSAREPSAAHPTVGVRVAPQEVDAAPLRVSSVQWVWMCSIPRPLRARSPCCSPP